MHNASTSEESPKHRFQYTFQWNLWGSILYQIFNISHQALLVQYIATDIYGLRGSIFALILLFAKFTDVGATYSLAPFFYLFKKNKQNFKTLILQYYLLPHLPIFAISLSISCFFYHYNIAGQPTAPSMIIFLVLIILTTINDFLRYVLHFFFEAKFIILWDVPAFILSIVSIWSYALITNNPITLSLIFAIMLVKRMILAIVFTLKTYTLYQQLPSTALSLPASLPKTMIASRLYNYVLRISRDFFTSNMLTPLFAFKFGLKSAGIFCFASTAISSLQTIFKITIGYSGKALLANLKENTLDEKREAFNILCTKLFKFVLPIIALLLFNYRSIMQVNFKQGHVETTFVLMLLYLAITCLEFLFVVYEQFYVIEEAAGELLSYKVIEFGLFYLFIFGNSAITTPVATLLGVIILRSISFCIIAIKAFFVWRIRPMLEYNINYVTSCMVGSLLLSLLIER